METGRSHGLVFVPKSEIENRITRLKDVMQRERLDAFLSVHKIDSFYLSGTAQDSLLFVPLEGEPLLMVRRELERAKIESPLENVVAMRSHKEIPSLIKDHQGVLPATLALEMDILPANDFFRYKDLFHGASLCDGSPIIRGLRKLKSPFEIGLMKKAGEIGKKVYEHGQRILEEGMTEMEFGGLLLARGMALGHEGILRVRSINYEAYSWHVLSGPSGGIVSQSDSPMGGLGLSPVFPVGASRRKMKAHEPILVDFGICYQGYQADETRMFSIGSLEGKFLDAYKACCEIHDFVLNETRPGADCETIFRQTVLLAERLGYKDSYLGPPGLQCRFVAHGLGLELNEYPFLARGQAYPLEQGMTFAVEPKMVFPGEGSVGIENTVLVTEDGYEILTPADCAIFQA